MTKLDDKIGKLLAKAVSCKQLGNHEEASMFEAKALELLAKLYVVKADGDAISAYSKLGEYNRTFGIDNEQKLGIILANYYGGYAYRLGLKIVFYGDSISVANVTLLYNYIRTNYSASAIEAYKQSVLEAKQTHKLTIKELYCYGYILTDGKFYRSYIAGALYSLRLLLKVSDEANKRVKFLATKLDLKKSARQVTKDIDTDAYYAGIESAKGTNLKPGVEKTEQNFLSNGTS